MAYSFGRFALDPGERQLYASGQPVPLGTTGFRLLLALVESAGTLLTKDELIGRVWGESEVGDNTLQVHMAALRKIVGDDCFVSKQGRGYRFIAQVQKTERQEPQRDRLQTGNLGSLWTSDAMAGPARLIGRTEQLGIVSELFARGRLVTLTGPGGVGKTRLAAEAAREASPQFRNGVWLVELAPLTDASLVAGAVASALGVKVGVNATALDALARYLARKSLLIVLDNCEHVIADAAALSEALLAAAPELKILATSREPLSCSIEQVLEVPPLALPHEDASSPALMRGTAAIELFVERATAADANFRIDDEGLKVASRICRRVDGLPLAIEMAAGWTMLGLETLDAKLDGSLKDWLRAKNTAPQRHSTLHATLEWSHDLLSAPERAMLCRLAVFAGAFTLEAAGAVVCDDTISKMRMFRHIANLIRKSMIAVVPGPGVHHYRLLQTTRAFMLEKLAASGDDHATRRKHACYVLHTLEEADRELETRSDAVWLKRYGPVLDDVRAALDWAMDEQNDDAVALAGASWPLWRELSLRNEGRQRLSAATTRLRPDTPPAQEARLRHGLSVMLLNSAAVKAAQEEIERAIAIHRTLDNACDLGSDLIVLANVLLAQDRTEEAEQTIGEALSLLEPAGWLRTSALAYSVRLWIEAVRGNTDAARIAGKRAARLSEMIGAGRTALSVVINLAQLNLESGDIEGAVSAGRDAVERSRDTPQSDVRGFALRVLASALTERGDLDEALAVAREAAPLLRDEGALFWLFDHLALRAALAGRAKEAALVIGYSNAFHERFGRAREPMERRAVERLDTLLRDTLPDEEIIELGAMGARLSEDQALNLALGD